MRIQAPVLPDRVGASVAVDGVCLTATVVHPDGFEADVVAETLARTTLGDLRPGDVVNLERALPASGRFDGHFVQGHVDATGEVVAIQPEGDGSRMVLRVPPGVLRYVVEKGSLAVSGVSLTVAAVRDDLVEVALVPHTLANTNLGRRRPGDRVNLEADILAKYVERLSREETR